jgi:hypothetical protein
MKEKKRKKEERKKKKVRSEKIPSKMCGGPTDMKQHSIAEDSNNC